MGLTIHYRLRSAAPLAGQAREELSRLRQAALDLPFERLGQLVELTGDQCDFRRLDRRHPQLWLLMQTQPRVPDPAEPGRRYPVTPRHVIAFSCWPGPGCEEANFGLARYPEVIEVEAEGGIAGRRLATGLHDWNWASFCKTQYAGLRAYGGQRNFRRCHLALLELLAEAQRQGLLHKVYDPAGYWESRQFVARILGLAAAGS